MWRLAVPWLQEFVFQPDDWRFYALGLLAASLLPVRTKWADQGVSLTLGVLWGLLALRAADDESMWWATFALLECGWFLGLGTIGRRLEFKTRNGAWAIIGTCFVIYSLFLLPVLGYFEIIQEPAYGIPFPLVLFTCGTLFFAAGWTTNLALVLPILWALFGGPSSDLVEVVGLQVALLTATFFFLLPSELRGGSDRRSPGASYKYAYKGRAVFGYGLWIAVLTCTFLTFLTVAKRVPEPWIDILPVVTTNLALLSVLGIALWLAFPAWQSLWYRYVAWWLFRGVGRIWVWFQGAWRWGLFLLAAAVLTLYLAGKSGDDTGQQQPPRNDTAAPGQQAQDKGEATPGKGNADSKTAASAPASTDNQFPTLFGKIRKAVVEQPLIRDIPAGLLLVVLLVWLSYQSYTARKRLVIGAFEDYTDGEKPEKWVQGLGARLQNDLSRIADLFKVIDETYPTPKASVIEVTPNVQDVGEVLKDASAFSIGSFQVSSKLLAGLVGSLVRGRRLTGALHKVGEEYVLTAELSGGGQPRSWRVDFEKLTEEERRLEGKAMVDRLVEQLAFRVATDLVAIGSPRWYAVRCYINGLRAQRETQRRQTDKNERLREAERSFIKALNDDQRFTSCHYNLGVVYRDLGERGSAESAFRRALKEDPGNFDACYGLALILAESDNPCDAVWFCEAAIEINDADPRPWDLEAFARREDEQNREGSGKPLPPDHRAWPEILERSEIAGALAWRALCRQLLRNPSPSLPTTAQANAAYLCIRNLAVVLTRSGHQEQSEQVFRQAAWIAPHDPDLRLYEGRTLYWHGKAEASAALRGVFDDGLLEVTDRALVWSLSAQAYARATDEESSRNARLAVRHFLDLAATSEAQDLENLLRFSLEAPPERQPSEAAE